MINPDKKPGLDRKSHWENLYSDKKANEVSWYQQYPARSLELLKATGVDLGARIIDIGAGASTLVDHLVDAGYQKITVLDIAQAAIAQAKSRLGDNADKVTWLEQDITDIDITGLTAVRCFDVWHDRAVFHFLTEVQDRENYLCAMGAVLKPGGHVIMATFNINGPEKCSGLKVVRYSPETLSAALGDSFQLVETCSEQHLTPDGSQQSFVYCQFIKQ